ncbi:efflux RND transporter periplasmic adaptor subunit [Flavobacteriaceae bacterium XHP0103]|uniref:efflux RND transporter periplasmic adaptor subunit n=1 Tax=Marixanthotalea marina TaxID=2844359 RepID=UPI002989C16F|nr:efflux RND transporter periplasmic adaptor subunit [Marixanthotalea marina]MBU3822185.1 efflux RND transporter periplasmic adaptor subunit [Marixanthotalea marina]
MRHIFYLLIFSFVITSCGNKAETVEDVIATNDEVKIKAKREALVNEQHQLAEDIKLLNDKIHELDPEKNLPLVTTLTAKTELFDHYLELQGNVDTKQNIEMYPEVSGILSKVYVKEGDKVAKGQLLANIDDGGLAQQVAQLEIQLGLAKTTFERQKRLWEQKIGSEIQYLQAKTSYEAQQETVNQLKKQLAKTSLRAPFSGIVDNVMIEQGSVVAPQSPIFRVINLDDMYIEIDVPESYIRDVVVGKDVQIEFPVLDKKIQGEIRLAGNFINPANRTFRIEVGVPNEDKLIKPNLTARLKINDYTNQKAILIPQNIISENANGEQYVYILKEKENDQAVANRVIIKTGKTQGDNVEVLSGIDENTEIIKEGARSVKDGQTVKITNQ